MFNQGNTGGNDHRFHFGQDNGISSGDFSDGFADGLVFPHGNAVGESDFAGGNAVVLGFERDFWSIMFGAGGFHIDLYWDFG